MLLGLAGEGTDTSVTNGCEAGAHLEAGSAEEPTH